MRLSQFVYKSHKWLAVVAGLFATLWFFSGMVMILPNLLLKGSRTAAPSVDAKAPSRISFRDVQVSVPDAIAVAETTAGHPVAIAGVSFRRLLGRLIYVLTDAEGGTYLVDALNGERIEINEERARQIVAVAVGDQYPVQGTSLLQRHDWAYKYGPLPAYRFVINDRAKSVLYVSAQTGEVQFTSRRGRIRALIVSAHTFGFLQPLVPDRWAQLALVVVAGVGLLLSLFGGWILWLQLNSWWRLRQRTV